MWLAYLRGAFNTCYYCACVTDHVEELQRKCIKHVRRPMSKATIAEISQQMGSGTKASESDETVPKDEQDGAEKPKEASGKEKLGDWKRNGKPFLMFSRNSIS